MSGGPLRRLGFADRVSRKDTPNKVRRAARGQVPGKKREIPTQNTDERVDALESEVSALKAAMKAAGLID